MTIEHTAAFLVALVAVHAGAILVPWRRLFARKPMSTPPPPPAHDPHILYRISWRWRSSFCAMITFPIGLLLLSYLLTPDRHSRFPAEIAPAMLDGKLHISEALLLSAFAALCALVYARAKNPAAYLKRP